MRVERYQFPIGQGCFHAGTISLPDEVSKEFHYVYDCGSTKKGVLQYAIDLYTAQTSSIEALFVSHLDDDHVSGLDRLLTTIEVNTVYIPYVDPWVLILDLIEAEMNGAISASLVEATIEPESWFGRRGVGRVVRIRGSDNPPPNVANEPNQDDSPPGAPDARGHHSNVQEPFGNLGVETPSPMQKLRKKAGERSELLEAEPGFKVIFSATSASNLKSDWLLLPHVDPAPKERRSVFKKRMRNVLGLQSKQRLTSVVLKEAFRDKEKRKAMRGCYDAIIANHNRVSMSLYSGPHQFNEGKKWEYCLQNSLWRYEGLHWPIRTHPFFPSQQSAVGWLGTGDADLQRNKVRENWQDTFEPLKDHVSTLLLPHHGSKKNFHSQLLQFPNLELCVASARYRSRHHPSPDVIGIIEKSGKIMHHVSQKTNSRLVETMRLAMK